MCEGVVMPYIFWGFFFISLSMAQHPEQPYKIDDEHFRGSSFVFKIVDENESFEVALEKTFEGNHFLKSIEDSEVHQIKKISSKKANILALDFSSNFLRAYHSLPEGEVKCKKIYSLQLKNQNLNICDDDKDKIKWIKVTLNSLEDLLKN